ncbi:MAG TPA: TonB-dependent receptor [Steroidobacteraceae bacterium]|nr:TonB-dependent receptor [Steroidobacteraceae bacterium]
MPAASPGLSLVYLLLLLSPVTTSAQSVALTAEPAPSAAAEVAASSDSDEGLPSVTVNADAECPVQECVTTTTRVDREDIERTPGADRSNSLGIITNFVPGAYVVHDQLHVRGGHQTTWAIDGVEIPNTNIASNLGPQIDPKDIGSLEVVRGSYGADLGDRTYGIFNVEPQTGLDRTRQGDLIVSGGNFGQTNDYLSIGSHSDDLAYFASVNANRSDLGLQTPVEQVLHDSEYGYGTFGTLLFDASPNDEFRVVGSARRDAYQIPQSPGDPIRDVQREADAFGILSWARLLSPTATLTTAVFFHHNQADLDGDPADFPISTTDRRSSTYAGGQESLRWRTDRHDLRAGLIGFAQQDHHEFGVLFNDGSSPAIHQALHPTGSLVAGYVQDTFRVSRSIALQAGLRQTHFGGILTENATSPRVGLTLRVPQLNWILRAYYGQYYQAPPLETLSGPLLQLARGSSVAFLPLRGERDRERQFGVTIPVAGWTLDADYFRTAASNFFDHNAIGNSDLFFPLTIQGALIRAWELTVRSPADWRFGQLHLAYSNQTADGFGAISGGLTDFSPAEGFFALDHDQRNTLNAGVDAHLPRQFFVAVNVYYGSGFANGDGPPSHLPGHASVDLSVGRSFGNNLSASVSALNVTNRRLLLDNSLTFGGFHYNNPREIFAEVRYRFGY